MANAKGLSSIMMMSTRSQIIFLITLFVATLTIRLLFFFYFTCHGTNAWIYVDSEQYHQIAVNIVQGNGICMDDGLQCYRVPGYPLFLAASYALFGVQTTPALLIQIIVSSLIPLLIYGLSLILFPGNGLLAMIIAGVACLFPGFILYAGMLATESLTLLFLLLFYIFFFRLLRHLGGVYYNALLAGMFLGVASLIRPIGHYVLAVAIALIFFSDVTVRQKMNTVLLLMSAWLIPVIPWLLRNFMLCGTICFHSLPGLHFVQYMAAPIIEQKNHCPYPEARAHVLKEWENSIAEQEKQLQRTLNEYERCVNGERFAQTYIRHYPLYACKRASSEIFKTCFGLYSAIILLADGAVWPDYGQHVTWWAKVQRFLAPSVRRPLLIPFIYLDIICTMLMLLGFYLFMICAWFDKKALWIVIRTVPFIVVLIFITLAYGGARLRMPADPLLMIGALYGWWWLARKMHDVYIKS